jgi:hypothetical protein
MAGEQFVRGEVPAACGQRERAAADVPPVPRQVDIGPGFDQGGQDGDATTAADRVVQAAVDVDVYAVVEEPAQPGEVFEVELVVNQILESRTVPLSDASQRSSTSCLALSDRGTVADMARLSLAGANIRLRLDNGGNGGADHSHWCGSPCAGLGPVHSKTSTG